MLNGERGYDFSFLGNQERLVITTITEKYY